MHKNCFTASKFLCIKCVILAFARESGLEKDTAQQKNGGNSVIEEFQMLSSARTIWRALTHDEKMRLTALVEAFLVGKTTFISYEEPLLLGMHKLVEINEEGFVSFYYDEHRIVLLELGLYAATSLQIN